MDVDAAPADFAIQRDVLARCRRPWNNALLTEGGLAAGGLAQVGVAEGLQEGQDEGVAVVALLRITGDGPAHRLGADLLQDLVPKVVPRLRHIAHHQRLPPLRRIIIPPMAAKAKAIELHDVAAGCGHCDMQIGGVAVIVEEIAGGGTQDNGARMLRGPHKRIWQAEGQEEEAWPGPV